MSRALSPGGVPLDDDDEMLADQLKAARLSRKDTEAGGPFPTEEQLEAMHLEACHEGAALGPPPPGEYIIVSRSVKTGGQMALTWSLTNNCREGVALRHEHGSRSNGYEMPGSFEPYPLTTEECRQVIAISRSVSMPATGRRDPPQDLAVPAIRALIAVFRQQKRPRPSAPALERFARLRARYIRSSALLEEERAALAEEKAALAEEKQKLADARASSQRGAAFLASEQLKLEDGKRSLAAAREALKAFAPLIGFFAR